MEKDNKIQSHGRSHAFYKDLQEKQEAGTVEFGPANNLNAVTDRWFKEDIDAHPEFTQVADHEREFYHILMEDRSFTPQGMRLSKAYVQKFSIQNFNDILNGHGGFMGKFMEILHDPTKEKGAKMTASKGGAKEDTGAASGPKAPAKAKSTAKKETVVPPVAPTKEKGADDLSVKSIAQLKKVAKDNGIDVKGATTKDALIAKIKAGV